MSRPPFKPLTGPEDIPLATSKSRALYRRNQAFPPYNPGRLIPRPDPWKQQSAHMNGGSLVIPPLVTVTFPLPLRLTKLNRRRSRVKLFVAHRSPLLALTRLFITISPPLLDITLPLLATPNLPLPSSPPPLPPPPPLYPPLYPPILSSLNKAHPSSAFSAAPAPHPPPPAASSSLSPSLRPFLARRRLASLGTPALRNRAIYAPTLASPSHHSSHPSFSTRPNAPNAIHQRACGAAQTFGVADCSLSIS
ncbi:unnamed protein product [Cutaneotrichosporon oleaginosum]